MAAIECTPRAGPTHESPTCATSLTESEPCISDRIRACPSLDCSKYPMRLVCDGPDRSCARKPVRSDPLDIKYVAVAIEYTYELSSCHGKTSSYRPKLLPAALKRT